MKHFSKRFNYIGRHLEILINTSELIDNRKLSRMIIEHNRVHYDLMLINDFFKSYVGFNLIIFFALGVTVIFGLLQNVDWR